MFWWKMNDFSHEESYRKRALTSYGTIMPLWQVRDKLTYSTAEIQPAAHIGFVEKARSLLNRNLIELTVIEAKVYWTSFRIGT